MAYQILNPGIKHWLTPGCDGVVGYVEATSDPFGIGHFWVAAGDPICAKDQVGEVAQRFEHAAGAHAARVCWFGADQRLREVLTPSHRYSEMRLGAQPVWDPSGWEDIVRRKSSLRAQINRAHNKGVAVLAWSQGRAHNHPVLQRILRDWLSRRGLPTLHFLVEPDTLGTLDDRQLLVAEQDGVPIAFLTLTPVPARHGWLVEQIVQARSAPNGTASLLIDAAMRWAAEARSPYVTLGLSPLSPHAPPAEDEPVWLRALLGWMRAHGRRFYNFRGLDAFKAKFVPDRWDPITAFAQIRRPSPRVLYAITDAFAGPRSPERLLGKALVTAVGKEAETLRGRISGLGKRTSRGRPG